MRGRVHRFVWVNTIVKAWWEHTPGEAYREIIVAATRHAAEMQVELVDDLYVQVESDEQLPEGLLKVVASAAARREPGSSTPAPADVGARRKPRRSMASDVVEQAEEILRTVAARHELTIDDIRGRVRHGPALEARREAMARLRELGLSYPQIGRMTGRDHSTVIHALRKSAA